MASPCTMLESAAWQPDLKTNPLFGLLLKNRGGSENLGGCGSFFHTGFSLGHGLDLTGRRVFRCPTNYPGLNLGF
jgi:hypothetical protein